MTLDILVPQYKETDEVIKPLLQDKDEDVAKNALIALYNLDGREILDEVISLPVYSEFLKGSLAKDVRIYARIMMGKAPKRKMTKSPSDTARKI